jgi:hypothetical protein
MSAEASAGRFPTPESASVPTDLAIAELREKIAQAHDGLRNSANEVEA